MPPEVAHHRGGVTQAARARQAFERAPGRVVAAGVRHLEHPPARLPDPQAEVDVLGAERRTVVETADDVERLAAEHLARADREVDVPTPADALTRGRLVGIGAIERRGRPCGAGSGRARRRPPVADR